MPHFDALNYDPPAPVAVVSIRVSAGGILVRNISLLIDTGADITLLPRWAVARLGAVVPENALYELIGFDGTRSTTDAVELEMIFLNKAFHGRYLLTDENNGILGRDVLAALKLLFNGPEEEWSAV